MTRDRHHDRHHTRDRDWRRDWHRDDDRDQLDDWLRDPGRHRSDDWSHDRYEAHVGEQLPFRLREPDEDALPSWLRDPDEDRLPEDRLPEDRLPEDRHHARTPAIPPTTPTEPPGPPRTGRRRRTVPRHVVCLGLALGALLLAFGVTPATTLGASMALTVLGHSAAVHLRGRRTRASGPDPLPPHTDRAAADAAITRYGERLARHPLHGHATPATAASWRIAFDAYDEAKRAEPGQVPEILARGGAALDGLARPAVHRPPAPLDPELSSHGTGPATVRLPKPEGWSGPCLLVFEGTDPEGFTVHARTGGRRSNRTVRLARQLRGPGAVRVPVPNTAEDALTVEITTEGPWWTALLPARRARVLHGTLHGMGSELLSNAARHHAAVFEHHGEGEFLVREPDAQNVTTGRILAEGEGPARLYLGLDDVASVHVDTEDWWSLAPHHRRV
ncbi:hypothetical protein HHL19_11735 [Streptomyces sp. R302]|uniref:hypothetical protein n=1 Tax=unclassified Streptomyces TaxID=2593676 RepID=UPI00145F1338|nr:MULTISPECIES: hypothetical protein [unclassified Streptomyces]NML50331.1 hypothetical protein [Streptomyces sp. R301]NML79322.1 hypothetical protein [Streptomyces sp. R302]